MFIKWIQELWGDEINKSLEFEEVFNDFNSSEYVVWIWAIVKVVQFSKNISLSIQIKVIIKRRLEIVTESLLFRIFIKGFIKLDCYLFIDGSD